MFNLFKPRPRYWITPGGKYWELFADMAQQPHLLIAGATGSGKSVVINGSIGTIIRRCSPSKAQFILIDPKRVELKKYQNLPHVIRYADTQQTMLDALVNILTAIRQADVVAKVKNVDVSNISNATFTYDAIYEVDFGSGVNADYKINKLISIVSQLEEGVKGRIDLSKEGRTHFIPA